MRCALRLLASLAGLACVVGLTGCSLTPAQLGITGPGTLKPPVQPDDADIATPGIQDGGSQDAPTTSPGMGGSTRYFGYN